MSDKRDLRTTIKRVLSALVRLDGMDCGCVHLMNERNGALELIAHRGLSAEFLNHVDSYHDSRPSPAAPAFIDGQSVYKNYAAIMAQRNAAERREKLRAMAFIPMVYDQRVMALLCVGSHTKDDIPVNTRTALEAIASQMKCAILQTIRARELATSQNNFKDLVDENTTELRQANVLFQQKITELELTERHLKISQEKLRRLSQHLELTREEERKRISRELHDELGQSLTVLKLDLLLLSDDFRTHENLVARIATINDFVSHSIMKSVQRISSTLRPAVLDELGLKAAIEWLTDELKRRKQITPEFITNFEELEIDPHCSTALFRITQEALTNVVRHAQASAIKIVLERRNKSLYLLIQDNGKGFDKSVINENTSLGLLGMHERALAISGELQIKSNPGIGTTVILTVPLHGSFKQ